MGAAILLEQLERDMRGTADEARELIKEAEKRWFYVRSPSEESATLAGQIALGNERLNLLGQWIEKLSVIREAITVSDEMAIRAHMAYFDDNGATPVEIACMREALTAAIEAK